MTALANRRSIMTLYADATDPVGHAVRLVLAEKDINVEIQFVNHETKPEDLNDLNPYHEILTLIDRDLVLYDPQIMLEYLDERYPHPPLMPVDPVSRANNRQLRYRVTRDLYAAVDDIVGDDAAAASNARRVIRDNLMAIAPIFSRHTYFLTEEYSLVECCFAPLLWRLDHYGIKLTPQAKPLMRYADQLFAREAFRTCLSPFEKTLHR
ncbi:MAG: glutathione S-transferase N-terminal domain-containing protein [Gammaproteobacteria bacterium]|nr:glutathione S-transferase N-terminal domain-containing protein [Gammaproteobacteria bacterium]MBI5618550.1 glutathione S-transferase N-terminal domain-containing protein [Gammaproteobacteria bacterium]